MRVVAKKSGNSALVRVPASVIGAATLLPDHAVDVREEAERIVIEPIREERFCIGVPMPFYCFSVLNLLPVTRRLSAESHTSCHRPRGPDRSSSLRPRARVRMPSLSPCIECRSRKADAGNGRNPGSVAAPERLVPPVRFHT